MMKYHFNYFYNVYHGRHVLQEQFYDRAAGYIDATTEKAAVKYGAVDIRLSPLSGPTGTLK